ncbi:MAG: hypothetical protein AAGC72_14495 [Planctomycetota bacterium]
MEYAESKYRVPVLETLNGRSRWLTREFPTETRGGMVLSPRIDCASLRLRQSKPGYFADWHVAGEPVLIVVQRGTLRIGLRDGETRDFNEGEAFIAADKIPEGQDFDPDCHGHTAKVVSETTLHAVHIKLTDI